MNEFQAEEKARNRDLGLALLSDPAYRVGYIEQLIEGSKQHATTCHKRKHEAQLRRDPVAATFADAAAGMAEAKAQGLQQAIDEHEAHGNKQAPRLLPAEASAVNAAVFEMQRSGLKQARVADIARIAGIKSSPGEMPSRRQLVREHLEWAHGARIEQHESGETFYLTR